MNVGDDVDALRDREWKLTWVERFSTIPPDGTPSIRFGSDGNMGAQTGCNSGGAGYTVEGNRLSIGPMALTKRACLESARNELEAAYVGAIQRTRRFRIANGELELLSDDGTVVARFR